MLDQAKEAGKSLLNRITNPFGGTLILVWVIYHWPLVYTLFTFDKGYTLDQRKIFFLDYINHYGCTHMIWAPIFLTLLSVIIYQAFEKITYGIIRLYNEWLKVFITKKTKGKLVETKLYDLVEDQLAELQEKYRTTKSNLTKQTSENDTLISEKDSAITERDGYKLQIDQKDKELDVLKSENTSLKNKYAESSEPQIMNTLFPGKWVNTYIFNDGIPRKETFTIKKDGKYAINNSIIFDLRNVIYNKDRNYLQFTKYGARQNDNRIAVNFLIKVTDNLYVGKEGNDTHITYSRVLENMPVYPTPVDLVPGS